jgi:hypothetical protein
MENKLIGCTVMLNSALRRILQSRQLPKQAKFHDWWIALIAASFGRIGYINEGTLYYRQHGNNVIGNTGFLSYFKDRITSLKKQREALLMHQRQAEEFLNLYSDLLDTNTRSTLSAFSNLNRAGFFKKRYQLLHYGFLKTGLIRNIGLLLII